MKRADMSQDQKTARNRQNAVSRNAYEGRTYDKLMLRVRKDGADGLTVDAIKAAAARDGLSVNAWILDAIRNAL